MSEGSAQERDPDALDDLRQKAIELGADPIEVAAACDEPTLFGLMLDGILVGSDEWRPFEASVAEARLNVAAARHIWQALGNADPALVSARDVDVLAFLDSVRSVVGAEATSRIARSMGAAASRLAEEVVHTLQFSLEWPRSGDQTPRIELAMFYKGFVAEMMPWLERSFASVLRRQIASRVPFDWPQRDRRLPERCAVVGVLRFGAPADEADDQRIVERLPHDISRSLRHRGYFVKFLGDGALFVFDDPDDLAAITYDLLRCCELMGLRPGVGLAWGPIATRSNDVAGPTVSTANRLAALAAPAEILATDAVVTSAAQGRWAETGRRVLVGVDGHATVFRLTGR